MAVGQADYYQESVQQPQQGHGTAEVRHQLGLSDVWGQTHNWWMDDVASLGQTTGRYDYFEFQVEKETYAHSLFSRIGLLVFGVLGVVKYDKYWPWPLV